MKMKPFLPLLLALALTGCSAGTERSTPDAVPETVPVADVTAGETAEVPAVTEAPTEKPTAPPSEAMRYLQDALVPLYGLSELTPYSPKQAPPASALGILSAVEQDFTGDGTPDLLIVRQDETACLLDLYTRTGADYDLAYSYTCCSAADQPAALVHLSQQDDLLLVNGSDALHRRYAVLRATDSGFEETAVLGYARSEDYSNVSYTINDVPQELKMDQPGVEDRLSPFGELAAHSCDALRSGGVRIPETEALTDISYSSNAIRTVSGMIQEQKDIFRHDLSDRFSDDSTAFGIDFTGLPREQAADSPEKIARRFLRTELIPAWGLSDPGATYDLAWHEDRGIEPELPHDAQGIVGAFVQDFGGTPVLLTIRAERTTLVLDSYRIGDNTCTPLASRTLPGCATRIYRQGDLLLADHFRNGTNSYTAELTALRLTADGLEDVLHIVQSDTPGKETLLIDGAEVMTAADVLDPDSVKGTVQAALGKAGIRCEDVSYLIASELPYEASCDMLVFTLSDEDSILTLGGFGAYRDVWLEDKTGLRAWLRRR